MKDKIYRCSICGNIVGLVDGDISRVRCCGKEMDLMVSNVKDAAVEKHVPVYEKDGNEIVVRVGEVSHPMTSEHYIMWVLLVKDDMTIKVVLHPESKPEVRFPYVSGSEIYAYCNLHGLWKSMVE